MNPTELRAAIKEILAAADLKSITAKKVREQLEAKFGSDLSDKKKEIDSLVMELVNEAEGSSSEESEEEKPAKKNGKKRAASSGSDSDDAPAKKGKKAKKTAPAKKGGGGTGFTRTLRLSKELAAVMGQDHMARHEVVKQMWKIIKEKNLYDPKNKQFAICNEELLPVFGTKRFRTFGMMKYLKNHFLD